MRGALLALLFVLAAFGPATARDVLTIGITQFPYTLHPSIEAMMAKRYVLGLTRRTITAFDQNWELVCRLCEILPTIENGLAVPEPFGNRTGVAVTYSLPPEAVWGDGTPITTRDVLFTWRVGRHPLSAVGPRELYRRIWKIDVHDDQTFTLHIDKLTFAYNAISGFELLPAHLEAAVFEADPEAYRTRTTYNADPLNPGLWFGPYRIAEVVAGSHIAVERNPAWWGEPPAFDRIVVRTIENTAALEANLLSGSVDMIAGELGLSLDQAIAFEQRSGDRFAVLYKPGLSYEHIDLNLDNPILADRRVRRALLHALDRAAINQRLFAGRQPVAHSNVNPLDPMAAGDVPVYGYDPERTATLLAEAGWARQQRGFRINADGEPLRLEFMTTAGNRSRELVQQVLQSQWKAVGVDVRIRNEPARVFFGETVTRRRFEAMAMFAWISSPESVPRTTLHSESIPTAENNWAGQNATGFVNAEMDALIDAIELELDRDKRRELWRRLQHLYAEELPALPLFFRADAYILPRWLKGVEPTGHQFPTTDWVERWHVAGP